MWRIPLLIMMLLIAFLQPAVADSGNNAYESKILMGDKGVAQGRLIVSGHRYRLDGRWAGQPVSLLVDLSTGRTYMMDAQSKTYRQIPTRDWQSLDLNPIEVFRLTAGFYPQQPGGRETIDGQECRKVNYMSEGRPLMTAWFSKDGAIPVKVVHHRFPEMNFELKEIRYGLVEPDLLAIPSDSDVQDTEWQITKGSPQTIALEEGQAFRLIVADDEGDGLATRGQMIFHRKAPPPADRVKAPLKLPNGKSFDLAYPASALITAVEFHISQGGIHVKKAQTEPK